MNGRANFRSARAEGIIETGVERLTFAAPVLEDFMACNLADVVIGQKEKDLFWIRYFHPRRSQEHFDAPVVPGLVWFPAVDEFLKYKPAMWMAPQGCVGNDLGEIFAVSVDVAEVDDFFTGIEFQAVSVAIVVADDKFGCLDERICDGMRHGVSILPFMSIRPKREY